MSETPVSNSAVYRARPVVQVNGAENERVSELLVGMRLEESEGGMSAMELRFSNVASTSDGDAELAFENEQVLRLGAPITVHGGDETQPRELFRGTITALEAAFSHESPPELVVLAEDALQRARMARRSAIYADRSLDDLARQIATRLALTPVVSGFSGMVGTWAQINESDLSFLRRLLARYDGDVQVVGGELHVAPRGEVRRGALQLDLFGQLSRLRATADLAHQITKVTARGWDAQGGRAVQGSTESGAHLGPGSGRSGAQLLRDALDARAEHLGHLAVVTEDEARAVAESAFDQRARRFVCIDGTTEGNAALRVGTHVTVRGASARFDNTYYVTRACHRYDMREGYQTDFTAECAYLGTA